MARRDTLLDISRLCFGVGERWKGIIIIGSLLIVSGIPVRAGSSSCETKCSYIEPYQQADCENRYLQTVPMECNAAAYLSLRHNQITRVEPGTFKTFPFLKYLILSNNRIRQIEANAFNGAPQLQSIKILHNNLQIFHKDALNGTEKRLRSVYLSRNSIADIHKETFQYALQIEFIDLYNNSLTSLTSGVFRRLGQLKRLFLGMNHLVSLPGDIFQDLSSLIYLDLSNNSIYSFDSLLFTQLLNVKTIDLSGNRLTDIGGAFSLPGIDRLDLRWNNLTTIENLTQDALNNLEVLYLEHNIWSCDCHLELLRLWYQEISFLSDHGFSMDSPLCSDPIELSYKPINSVNVSFCPLRPHIINNRNFPLKIDLPNTISQMNSTDANTASGQSSMVSLNSPNVSLAPMFIVTITIIIVVVVVVMIVVLTSVACYLYKRNKKRRRRKNDNEEGVSLR